MNTEIIGIWEGNYKVAVSLLYCKCRDLRVRQSGSRLIIKDSSIEYYACIPKGDPIRIPVYAPIDDDDDPPLVLEEPVLTQQQIASMSAEQEELQRKWGLIK